MQEFINLKNEFTYLKTHNAMCTINNHPFTNSKNTIGIIYLVRDPRDVILSYSKFLNKSIVHTFNIMKNSSIAPFDFCGVPTATKIISESLTNEKSSLIVNFFFNPIFSVFSKSGSKNGVIPLQIFLHFLTSTSIPITLFPFDANTLASDNPTKPKPITAIFILSSKFLILKIMPS